MRTDRTFGVRWEVVLVALAEDLRTDWSFAAAQGGWLRRWAAGRDLGIAGEVPGSVGAQELALETVVGPFGAVVFGVFGEQGAAQTVQSRGEIGVAVAQTLGHLQTRVVSGEGKSVGGMQGSVVEE